MKILLTTEELKQIVIQHLAALGLKAVPHEIDFQYHTVVGWHNCGTRVRCQAIVDKKE